MIYINITNGTLRPVMGQSDFLDNNFDAKKNHSQFNDYTKNFIAKAKNDIYVSSNFDYDPETLLFNFYEISPLTGADYDELVTYKFDHTIKYKGTPTISDEEELSKINEENTDIETFVDEPVRENVSNNDKSTKLLKKIKKDFKCPRIEDGFYVNELTWNYLVRNILKKKNTILFGPTGTGKTDIIIRIAKQLGIELNIYDMGAMIDPLTDLLGTHRIKDGNSVFDYAKFVSDVQKPGIILLDELSRAPLMTNNILFPCLDHRRTLNIELAGSEDIRAVKVHPDCVFIATANIGQEYSGTNDIDAALLNRFNALQVEYLPQDIEAKILNVRTGISLNDADKILNIANAIRDSYLKQNISKPISTRETLEAAEMIVDGFSIKNTVNLIFCQKFSKSDNNEYDTVKKLIMGF